jgi:hypothetical protein
LVKGPTLVAVPTVTGAPFTHTDVLVKKSAAVALPPYVKFVVYFPVAVFVELFENDPFIVVTMQVLTVPGIVAVHLTAFKVVPDVKCSASFSIIRRYFIRLTMVLDDDVNGVPLLLYIGLVITVDSSTSLASRYSPLTLGLYTVNDVLLGVIGHAPVAGALPFVQVDEAGRTVLSSTYAKLGTFTT